MPRKVFNQIARLTTESSNRRTKAIDILPTRKILELINAEDHKVAPAVRKVIPQITQAVDLVVRSFREGGRLFYVGAGTSGRLGILDASECPPTFGVKPSLVQGLIAGGRGTLVRSREGVEDNRQAGKRDIEKKKISNKDTVIAIATSNRTPYTLAALHKAGMLGAKTVFICCNFPDRLPFQPNVVISPILGPEVLTGSTRMKAGTATKLILNMITTAAMIRIGKTYGNLMVDLQATSEKLAERSIKIIMAICSLSYAGAKKLLKRAEGRVSVAIVMHLMGSDLKTATNLLKNADGHIGQVLRRKA